VRDTLLSQSDPQPVRKNGDLLSPGPFFLLGDHAGSAIPAALGDLGLAPADRQRHIALDIGVEALGLRLAERLGAPFVRQAFSRLVIDCNRDPARPDAVPEISDGTPIPGNTALDGAARQSRINEVFAPYHHAIHEALDARAAAGLETVLVAVHSFTPVMQGFARPWHIGVLYDRGDTRFALRVLESLQGRDQLCVAGNEPYRMDLIDHTIPHHAYPRGLRYAEIEVRQDLIDPAAGNGVEMMAQLLAETLRASADA